MYESINLDTISGFWSALNLTFILAVPLELILCPESTDISFILCSNSGFLNIPNNDFFNLDTLDSSSPNNNLASNSISNLSRPIEEWSANM